MGMDVLPDDVLLEIFDFYVKPLDRIKSEIEAWQSLVHVCRRWRSLVLGSPRRLNLRLVCTPETPARDTLDVWPPLPLIARGCMIFSGTDNIIATLEQRNRVCEVDLWGLLGTQMEKILATMQVPFPELTDLRLHSFTRTLIPIPDSFLDGSAPRLRIFTLSGIPFPGFPTLLLSATHLVNLGLTNIPHSGSGYMSPEAMAALLSMLSSLERLTLEFRSLLSHPGWEARCPPPSKRSVIPAFRGLHFKGVTKYLEDLVTFIDAPQLYEMEITFFDRIDF